MVQGPKPPRQKIRLTPELFEKCETLCFRGGAKHLLIACQAVCLAMLFGASVQLRRARVKRNSSTVMRVRKQWPNEHRITRKTGNGLWMVTSTPDDRHLLHMAVNDCTASTRKLVAH
ncbi:hypothetical protein TNCV_44631 [Trichonephila clavipes]|nr:hypothetical protein TNCV_44631 [Trichonephila clavipes]